MGWSSRYGPQIIQAAIGLPSTLHHKHKTFKIHFLPGLLAFLHVVVHPFETLGSMARFHSILQRQPEIKISSKIHIVHNFGAFRQNDNCTIWANFDEFSHYFCKVLYMYFGFWLF